MPLTNASGNIPVSLRVPYEVLATTGSDQRLIPGSNGRNPYGARVLPDHAMQLGSCTCSSPSQRAAQASRHALDTLRNSTDPQRAGYEILDSIRRTIRRCLQLSSSTQIALTPSGTDLELLPLATLAADNDKHITNIVVGASEVGSGTAIAAAGCHPDSLLPCGSSTEKGQLITNSWAGRIDVCSIAVRNQVGEPRSMTEIDDEVTEHAVDAASRGHRVLVHIVAHSKTGIHAPSLSLINRLQRNLGDDVMILVDAAQGRLAVAEYQRALDRGYYVAVTGSKFYGGPPFAGALLVPGQQIARTDAAALGHWPRELGSYFHHGSLPDSWQVDFGDADKWVNVGLLLRWAGAAAEMDAFFAIPEPTRHRIAKAFRFAIEDNFSALRSIRMRTPTIGEDAMAEIFDARTVFSFEQPGANRESLAQLHRDLLRQGFYLGQPVKIGTEQWALRVALGAPLMIDVAQGNADRKDCRESAIESRLENMTSQIRELANRIGSVQSTSSIAH